MLFIIIIPVLLKLQPYDATEIRLSYIL